MDHYNTSLSKLKQIQAHIDEATFEKLLGEATKFFSELVAHNIPNDSKSDISLFVHGGFHQQVEKLKKAWVIP